VTHTGPLFCWDEALVCFDFALGLSAAMEASMAEKIRNWYMAGLFFSISLVESVYEKNSCFEPNI
jgi:hypothetical protein